NDERTSSYRIEREVSLFRLGHTDAQSFHHRRICMGRLPLEVGYSFIGIQLQPFGIGPNEPAAKDATGKKMKLFALDGFQESRTDSCFCSNLLQGQTHRLASILKGAAKF